MRLRLVAPALGGPLSGGTLYNSHLLEALREQGVACEHLLVEQAEIALDGEAADLVLLDSLHLDAAPALCEQARRSRVYLLLHYLPALVEHGREVGPSGLSRNEREALASVHGFVVTSDFMQRALSRLVAEKPSVCAEPGVAQLPAPSDWNVGACPRGVMLCNLVAAKGVLELLEALAAQMRADDAFELVIAGRTDMDPSYAATCADFVARDARLDGRVRLLGGLGHDEALALLTQSDALLSASRMEAYGMALAEARAAGVPILARTGGHAAAHVGSEAGGELVPNAAALAASWLALVRNREELRERRRLALVARRSRSWGQAADDLIAGLEAAEGLSLRARALR